MEYSGTSEEELQIISIIFHGFVFLGGIIMTYHTSNMHRTQTYTGLYVAVSCQ